MKDFQKGQVVTLASGGPLMTVIRSYYSSDSVVDCIWHDGESFYEITILSDVLEAVELETVKDKDDDTQ